jgi:hypothetical protein
MDRPPRTTVHVQTILFASLAASLLSAFLAVLGKQWLNRYASIDMRGSAIQRSQNRQRKLDGIVTWYFNHVMEALPLMLQIALFLLGCALSRYFWEINVTIASVVLAVTSFGTIFYVFILVAGTASESCPYQTPGARTFRHILSKLFIFVSSITQKSRCYHVSVGWWSSMVRPWYSTRNITEILWGVFVMLIALAIDACLLGREVVWLLAAFCRRVYGRFTSTSTTQAHSLDNQSIKFGLRCASWMLQTSLDKVIHLSTLEHLVTMTALTEFDPTLVGDCFNIFIGCINVSNRKVVIMQGSEQLLTLSAICCLHSIPHLLFMDPNSRILGDIRQRYITVLPFMTDFNGLPSSHILGVLHSTFHQTRCNIKMYPDPIVPCLSQFLRRTQTPVRPRIHWEDYEPSGDDHIMVARAFTRLAWFRCQMRQHGKVPRWLLRFVLHSLSQYPPPQTPVVVDCLSIIAISLGHSLSDVLTLDERCVHIREIPALLIKNQRTERASLRYDKPDP